LVAGNSPPEQDEAFFLLLDGSACLFFHSWLKLFSLASFFSSFLCEVRFTGKVNVLVFRVGKNPLELFALGSFDVLPPSSQRPGSEGTYYGVPGRRVGDV